MQFSVLCFWFLEYFQQVFAISKTVNRDFFKVILYNFFIATFTPEANSILLYIYWSMFFLFKTKHCKNACNICINNEQFLTNMLYIFSMSSMCVFTMTFRVFSSWNNKNLKHFSSLGNYQKNVVFSLLNIITIYVYLKYIFFVC